ncbi:MAG: hypothetical protein AB8F78_00170 [Saprospiraceae bacterium]
MFEALKNIFKPDDQRRALEFWTWFFANEKHYRNMDEDGPDERDHRIKIFLDHLAGYNHELTFVTGQHADGTYELIISADGIQKHFPSVETLINAVPALKKWRFIAFKQPQPDLGSVTLNDKSFELDQLKFARVNNPEAPEEMNIVIFHPAYQQEDQELHVVATYMLLDGLIGERSVVEDIQGLDVQPVNTDVPANVLRPLKALPQVIASLK